MHEHVEAGQLRPVDPIEAGVDRPAARPPGTPADGQHVMAGPGTAVGDPATDESIGAGHGNFQGVLAAASPAGV